jgi:hypothetical protein
LLSNCREHVKKISQKILQHSCATAQKLPTMQF